ncbi:hypothetical protein P8452_08609 [Trifolium repens]|nr:hypothetical protein P8452_08609 [Trifolium repens]
MHSYFFITLYAGLWMGRAKFVPYAEDLFIERCACWIQGRRDWMCSPYSTYMIFIVPQLFVRSVVLGAVKP